MHQRLRQWQDRSIDSPIGALVGASFLRLFRASVLSPRTAAMLRFDLMRLGARRSSAVADRDRSIRKLHLGCGKRQVAGWLNVDVVGSPFAVDLGRMPLPFGDGDFDVVVSQQVIEHLDYDNELAPLLADLRRAVAPGGVVWLSCPDMEKICRAYLDDKGAGLVADKRARLAHDPTADGRPSQFIVNWLFHQGSEHKNLFDLEMLRWAAARAGFESCVESSEEAMLAEHPEFPRRNDGYTSIYVKLS